MKRGVLVLSLVLISVLLISGCEPTGFISAVDSSKGSDSPGDVSPSKSSSSSSEDKKGVADDDSVKGDIEEIPYTFTPTSSLSGSNDGEDECVSGACPCMEFGQGCTVGALHVGECCPGLTCYDGDGDGSGICESSLKQKNIVTSMPNPNDNNLFNNFTVLTVKSLK